MSMTDAQTAGKPTLLAIGYEPDSLLRYDYRHQVLFKEPTEVMTETDIPDGINCILVERLFSESPQGQLVVAWAIKRQTKLLVCGSGLVTLKNTLSGYFGKHLELGPPTAPTPKPRPKPVMTTPVPAPQPREDSESKEVILQLRRQVSMLENEIALLKEQNRALDVLADRGQRVVRKLQEYEKFVERLKLQVSALDKIR